MHNMILKKFAKAGAVLAMTLITSSTVIATAFAATPFSTPKNQFLEAVITADDTVAIQKSTIMDASSSFLPDPDAEYTYEWDFGDGNKNEGEEVLHIYKNPKEYTVTLRIISDKNEESVVSKNIYAHKKMILLLTDKKDSKILIQNLSDYAANQGVYIKTLDSFGSASEFISGEILTKKLSESSDYIKKSLQIVTWTKANTGMNALSRFIQATQDTEQINFSQKSITVLTDDVSGYSSQIKRQFQNVSPKNIIITQESGVHLLVDNFTSAEFIEALSQKGYEHEVLTESSFSIRPWNFVSYFLSVLVEKGIAADTLALLLLLPVIATVVAFMKQIIGLTTMGIYTPVVITLSFMIIGIYFGLLTLVSVLLIGGVTRHLLRKVRLLFIPKMAIVMVLVSLTLIFILIITDLLGIYDATFFSHAIFPMVILSTLVEKFVSIKTEKGLVSALTLMGETMLVAITAFIVVGGEVNIGFTIIDWNFIRNLILNYPELIFLLIGINILLGRWSGLRILEYVRFREVIRHIEE